MQVPDLNVFLYAVNADSTHHAAARDYLERVLNGGEPVAIAWVVILGFLRIATSPRVLPKPLSPDQAMEIVDGWLDQPVVEILAPGREHWRILKDLLRETGAAANLTSDAHLAALAIENGATLVTFDADFTRFRRLKTVSPARA